MYGYRCEYCRGIVKEKLIEREAFEHRKRFVILENVPVGICDNAVACIITQQYCRESKRSLKAKGFLKERNLYQLLIWGKNIWSLTDTLQKDE